jgi:hypothetical protein
LPEKAVLKWQGVLHKAHNIIYSNYYGVSSCEYYNERDIASFYTNSLQKNGWHSFSKKIEYDVDIKEDLTKYTWLKNDYKLVLKVYSCFNKDIEDIDFESVGFKKGDYIYGIKIYW